VKRSASFERDLNFTFCDGRLSSVALSIAFVAIFLVSADSDASLKAKLDQKVTIEIQPTSLKEALDQITKQFRVRFEIDSKAFPRIGSYHLPEESCVMLRRLENVPLGRALDKLLNDMGASYRVRDGIIFVVPQFDPVIKCASPEEEVRLVIDWAKPAVERKDGATAVIISGKAYLRSADGKSRKPVNWAQPISVALSRSYRNPPNWTHGLDEQDTVWNEGWINWDPWELKPPRSDGSFLARFEVRKISRAVGATKRFRVGVVLGRMDDEPIWSPDSPPLPQSVAEVEIPGPGPISPTLQLINACTLAPRFGRYNPARLVRAVNHLRGLGKEKAIAAVREYLCLGQSGAIDAAIPIDPANIDTANPGCVLLIVPLLFESLKAPPPLQAADLLAWQDIPFLTSLADLRNKGVECLDNSQLAPLVNWAVKHGRLIPKPLRPPDDPCRAVDELIVTLQSKAAARAADAAEDSSVLYRLRLQAWNMLAHIPGLQDNRRAGALFPWNRQEEWDRLKADARRLKVHWDENRQEYMAN
jgi:hypothetical protein